jgi:HMG (high mobility group) box
MKPEISKTVLGDQIVSDVSSSMKNKGTISAQTGTKAKNRGWRKPVDKPKRPLSAYNIFFQLERDRIVDGELEREFTKEDVAKVRILPIDKMPKRKDRKIHGKISFADLARQIGAKWTQMSDDSKAIFNDRAKHEKLRYSNEINHWTLSKNIVSQRLPDCSVEQPVILALGKDPGNSLSTAIENRDKVSEERGSRLSIVDVARSSIDKLHPSQTSTYSYYDPNDLQDSPEDEEEYQNYIYGGDEGLSSNLPYPSHGNFDDSHMLDHPDTHFIRTRNFVTDRAYNAAAASYRLAQKALHPRRRMSIDCANNGSIVARYDQAPILHRLPFSNPPMPRQHRQIKMRRSNSLNCVPEEYRMRAILNARQHAATRQLQMDQFDQRLRDRYLMEADVGRRDYVTSYGIPGYNVFERNDLGDWGGQNMDDEYGPPVTPSADYEAAMTQCSPGENYDSLERSDNYQLDDNINAGYGL